MGEILLEVKGVNKAFGGVVTANNIDMMVEAGKIRGLIGPNGAGKTTLLNLISGIYDVDSGQILFKGQDITNVPAENARRWALDGPSNLPALTREPALRIISRWGRICVTTWAMLLPSLVRRARIFAGNSMS